MIITIDGPAGTGKSTVAKRLAKDLGFTYLDTGAMYRACALWGQKQGVDWDNPDELTDAVKRIPLRMENDCGSQKIYLGEEDVTDQVRTPEVTAITKFAANNPDVRALMVALQQDFGNRQNLVTEGRDQGTVVFPRAELKIYLLARAETRAQRRFKELQEKGESADFQTVLESMVERDRLDESRAVGPLKPAPDAIFVHTDDLNVEQVVEKIKSLMRND